MNNLSAGSILIFTMLNLNVVNAATQAAPQGTNMPPAQSQGMGPIQPVSTNDVTVQKAAQYAAQQMPGNRVAKIVQAQRQGKDAEIYVMTLRMTNGKMYRVEVCAPQNKPWKMQNMQQIAN